MRRFDRVLGGRRSRSRVVVWVVGALLLAAALWGTVSAAPPAQGPDGGAVRVGAADAGRIVALRAGQELVVRLEANPSTGYAWMPVGLDRAAMRQAGPPAFETNAEPGQVGAPGQQVLRFRPLRAGRHTLRLAYRRPWEAASTLRTFTVDVSAEGPFGAYVAEPTPTPSPTPAPAEMTVEEDQASLALPASFDWCAQDGCTPVQDQGSCGSCWAFATAGVTESAIKIHDGVERDLSEQYLVSCNTNGWGCNGGWRAFDYYIDAVPSGEPEAGAVYEADFPYTARDDACNPPHTHHEKLIDWNYTTSSVAAIKQAIYDYGPVYVSVCAGSEFINYDSGVFANETNDCTSGTNHGVILVGWDDSQGANGVWFLKNSWGTGWGESGYMRIAYGTSNVETSPTYVVYGGSDDVGPISYSGRTVDDDAIGQSVGDGDGVAECGEALELYVDLRNEGGDPATDVVATLSTTDPYVVDWFDSNANYGSIAGGASSSGLDDFDFTLADEIPNGHAIQFALDITSAEGSWSDSFSLPVSCVSSPSDWTFLVYLDGDNNLEGVGLDDFLEMSSVGSNGNVNIVVQFDRVGGYDTGYGDWTDARRFHVTPGLEPWAGNGTSIGEVNMGDPQTLIDFVAWGVERYPAERYALVLWDHGSGWRVQAEEPELLKDVAYDATSGDSLEMPELRSALHTLTDGGAAPIDLLGFDACLMAMIEVDNQLIPYADVRVGSEETEPGAGWPYDTLLSQLVQSPTMTPAQLGTTIVDAYYASYGNDMTQSAVDLEDAYVALNTAVDDLAGALIDGVGEHYVDIVRARNSTQGFYYLTYLDLYDLAAQLQLYVDDAAIDAAAGAVMSAVDSAVIRERHGTTWPGAHGISISFPAEETDYDSRYDGGYGWLQFTADTRWDEWLHAFYDYEACGDPYEANDIPAQAIPAGLGAVFSDPDICAAEDEDYYAFTGQAGDQLIADIDARAIGSSLDSYIYLYNVTGTEVISNDDADGFDSYLSYILPEDGTYYLRVRDYDSDGGPAYFYNLTFSGSRVDWPRVYLPLSLNNFGAPPECIPDYYLSCGGSDSWNNGTYGSTDQIDTYSCTAWDESGPEYVYTFQPAVGGPVEITLSNLSTDLDVFVLDGASGLCQPTNCIAYGNSVASFDAEAGRTYYVVVDGYEGNEGDYTISVSCDNVAAGTDALPAWWLPERKPAPQRQP